MNIRKKRRVAVKKRVEQVEKSGKGGKNGNEEELVVVGANDKNGVRDFLSHYGLSKLRFNELKQDVEVMPEKDIEAWKMSKGIWQPLDKEDGDILDVMHVTAKAVGRRTPKTIKKKENPADWPKFSISQMDFRISVAALAMERKRHNAWSDFVKGLSPAKDDSFLAVAYKECFDVPKTARNDKGELNDYYMDAIRLPFVTILKRQKAIAEMDEEGYHCRVSLLLRGPPGCGKSSFFSETFPKEVGRSLYLEKLNIENEWPDPEARRTLGKASCHTPEYHKYMPKQVQNWVSSHDLPSDTVKVLYRQRMKLVVRGWAHTFSANLGCGNGGCRSDELPPCDTGRADEDGQGRRKWKPDASQGAAVLFQGKERQEVLGSGDGRRESRIRAVQLGRTKPHRGAERAGQEDGLGAQRNRGRKAQAEARQEKSLQAVGDTRGSRMRRLRTEFPNAW